MKAEVIRRIEDTGIVAIVRGVERSGIVSLGGAFLEGGIRCVEITFDTPEAAAMIADLKDAYGERLSIGAGTVLTVGEAMEACRMGAEFILSPSLHREVIEFCTEHELVSVPGAYTPTEIVLAKQYGADIIKLFPAAAMGTEYIKMVQGPLHGTAFMAVGGVNEANAEGLLRCGCMSLGVGGSLVDKERIARGDFAGIAAAAKRYIEIAKKTGKTGKMEMTGKVR